MDYKPETPTARDSSAFTRRRMSTLPDAASNAPLREDRSWLRSPAPREPARRRPVRPHNEIVRKSKIFVITRDCVSRTTVFEIAGGERHTFEGCADVSTAQSKPEGTPESADACRRPRGSNNTGTPYMVKDRGNGGLAPPAVHQPDAVGLPVPERTGSPVIGLQT